MPDQHKEEERPKVDEKWEAEPLLRARLEWEAEHPRPESLRRVERAIVRALVAEGFGDQYQVTANEWFEIAVDDLVIRVSMGAVVRPGEDKKQGPREGFAATSNQHVFSPKEVERVAHELHYTLPHGLVERALMASGCIPAAVHEAGVKRSQEALRSIRDTQGKVCDGYELCEHAACASSYAAWAIADEALREGA